MLLSLVVFTVFSQGLPIKDGNSSTLVDVDSAGNLQVVSRGLDGGALAIVDKNGNFLEFADDGRVDVSRDTPLFRDTFVGSAVASNNRWLQSLTTMTATVGSGAITLNAGAITTLSTYANLTTVQKYRGFADGALYFHARARPINLPVTNATAELGLGNALTNAAPTDGAFFRWNASGGFECVVTRSSTETSSSMTAPTASVYSIFSIKVQADIVICSYETPSTGASVSVTITIDSGAPSAFGESPGGLMRVYTGGVAPALAPQLSVGIFEISMKIQDMAGRDNIRDPGQGLMAAYLPTTGAQTANNTNSVSPTSATLSNTAAGYATLGGRYQFAAVAGAATDYALFGIQTPTSFRLVVTRISISTCLEGAAIATTATRLDWSAGVGSTAVSLATTDATGAAPTSAPRRFSLGSQGFPLVAPRGPAQIGDCADTVYADFTGAPLIVESGRFFHIILQMPVGSATASQIFRGTVTVAGRYEQ